MSGLITCFRKRNSRVVFLLFPNYAAPLKLDTLTDLIVHLTKVKVTSADRALSMCGPIFFKGSVV